MNKKLEKQAQGYERMLIKLEADIRKHISNEHQFKLYIEEQKQTCEDIKRSSFIKLREHQIEINNL